MGDTLENNHQHHTGQGTEQGEGGMIFQFFCYVADHRFSRQQVFLARKPLINYRKYSAYASPLCKKAREAR